MNNDTTHRDTSSNDASDPELQQILGAAYDVPPVPRALLERVDRALETEWGESPGLVDDAPFKLPHPMLLGRWVRAGSVAASLTLAVVLLSMFATGSGSYAWAAMVDAIAKQGVMQVNDPSGLRWLALADGLVGEQTSQSHRLLDIRQRCFLTRHASETVIHRQSLPAQHADINRDRLLVSFLLGSTETVLNEQQFAGLRVVDESFERVNKDGQNAVSLRVRFASDQLENLELGFMIDPETHLPTQCEVLSRDGLADATAPSELVFTKTKVNEMRELYFAADLAIVDVDPGTKIASLDRSTAPKQPFSPSETPKTGPFAEEIEGPDKDDAANKNSVQPAIAKADQTVDLTPLMGAATKWKPVHVMSRSSMEVRDQINKLLVELWTKKQIEPAAPADDEELLRRVYLDLAGRTPSVSEIRAYLKDKSADRYERVVDRLLDSPDHASHLAAVWRTFLIPEGVDLTAFGGIEAFDQWLAERFASHDSYDQIARSLLLAEGRLSRSGPLLFYSATKLDPDQLAARTSRVFLGMRLECAQCHDHPFEPWTQEDFWSYAAFFARISRPQGELENVSTVMRVHDVPRGEVMLPETDTVVPPRFLDGADVAETEVESARRQQLAAWLTGAKNPYFARATVNRVWGQMFGTGIVEPIDDFGLANPPKSAELLELLASQFIDTNFDLRELFRTIALSRAYQLSSGSSVIDESRVEAFAQMSVKTLTAEQVYDCITVATLLDPKTTSDMYNVARFNNADRAAFLSQFRTPVGQSTKYQGGIPQALTLMNGALIDGATGISSSGILKSLEAPFFTNEQRVEVLYLATLSRRPRESETEILANYIPENARGSELNEGLSDILWALLNSAEFTLNH